MHLKYWQSILGLVSAQRAETKCASSGILWKSRGLQLWWWTKGISCCYSYLLMCLSWFLRNLVITPGSYWKQMCYASIQWVHMILEVLIPTWSERKKTTEWTIPLVIFITYFIMNTEIFSVYMAFIEIIFIHCRWLYCEKCFLLFWGENCTSSFWTEERKKYILCWHCIASS